jgi:hypothetical protein
LVDEGNKHRHVVVLLCVVVFGCCFVVNATTPNTLTCDMLAQCSVPPSAIRTARSLARQPQPAASQAG